MFKIKKMKNRSQNFSELNNFDLKKRLQIKNMINNNFEKLVELSNKIIDGLE